MKFAMFIGTYSIEFAITEWKTTCFVPIKVCKTKFYRYYPLKTRKKFGYK